MKFCAVEHFNSNVWKWVGVCVGRIITLVYNSTSNYSLAKESKREKMEKEEQRE